MTMFIIEVAYLPEGFGNAEADTRYNRRFCPKYRFNKFEFRSLRILSLCSGCPGNGLGHC